MRVSLDSILLVNYQAIKFLLHMNSKSNRKKMKRNKTTYLSIDTWTQLYLPIFN